MTRTANRRRPAVPATPAGAADAFCARLREQLTDLAPGTLARVEAAARPLVEAMVVAGAAYVENKFAVVKSAVHRLGDLPRPVTVCGVCGAYDIGSSVHHTPIFKGRYVMYPCAGERMKLA